MPLPSTAIIHPSFSTHHQGAIETSFTATCTITRRTQSQPGEWNPVTGDTATPDPVVIYTGPCRVSAVPSRATRAVEATDQSISTRDYKVAIPTSAAAVRAGADGDLCTIGASPDDPLLAGRVLTVTDIAHGSVSWERNLICTDDLTRNNPTID